MKQVIHNLRLGSFFRVQYTAGVDRKHYSCPPAVAVATAAYACLLHDVFPPTHRQTNLVFRKAFRLQAAVTSYPPCIRGESFVEPARVFFSPHGVHVWEGQQPLGPS